MYSLKHSKEWIFLYNLAKENELTKELIIFLFALRELENGEEGNEFNIKAAKGTDLEEQALWAIGSIKANELRWQNYLINTVNIDFVEFFAVFGGPYKTGWHSKYYWTNHNYKTWTDNLRFLIQQIEKQVYLPKQRSENGSQ